MGRDPSLTASSMRLGSIAYFYGSIFNWQWVPLDCIVKLRDTKSYCLLSSCVIKSCNLEVVLYASV